MPHFAYHAIFLTKDQMDVHEFDVFVITGFRSWKRVRDGKNCAFLKHIGKDPCSHHNNVVKACNDLLNQRVHIRHGFQKQSSSQIMKNRLRLKASIDVVR